MKDHKIRIAEIINSILLRKEIDTETVLPVHCDFCGGEEVNLYRYLRLLSKGRYAIVCKHHLSPQQKKEVYERENSNCNSR